MRVPWGQDVPRRAVQPLYPPRGRSARDGRLCRARRGAWGWSLFGIVWGLALLGIVQELWLARGARWLSLALYVSMGSRGLVAVYVFVG